MYKILTFLLFSLFAYSADLETVSTDDDQKHRLEEKEANALIEDALLLQEAGCFALILEKVPAKLASNVSKKLEIPVIGIGAGGGVDGQVLVLHDMLGITQEFSPRFLRRYHNLHQ